jgi:hypothetical protein
MRVGRARFRKKFRLHIKPELFVGVGAGDSRNKAIIFTKDTLHVNGRIHIRANYIT